MSPSYLNPATAIFVVDWFQFGPSWIFGLKMELMVCDGLVGGTTEQSYLFPDFIWWYQWYEILSNCLHYTSALPQPFLLLIGTNLTQAVFWAEHGAYVLYRLGWWYNRAKLYFSWHYMIVLMVWNTSVISPSHLSRATAIFVVGCCQFGPSWIFGLEMELMACADLVGGTTEKNLISLDTTLFRSSD